MSTHYKLEIEISGENNTIQIKTIDMENENNIIYYFLDKDNKVIQQMHSNPQTQKKQRRSTRSQSIKKQNEEVIHEENKLTICFDKNEILLSVSEEENIENKENEEENKTIITTFIQDILESPNEYQMYTIQYNNKEYTLYSETLFCLYLLHFKRSIEKNGIIKQSEITLKEKYKNLNIIQKRLHRALFFAYLPHNAISKAKIIVEHEEEYKQQENILGDIIYHHEEYLLSKRQLETAKMIVEKTDLITQQTQLKDINLNDDYNQQKIYEIGLQFNTKQKVQLKLFKLNNYCIFLAAKYFESIEDYFNLETAVKRFRGTMDKFHYNPISLTSKTVKFFPNVETLHLYETSDKFLTGQRIQWYCVWYVESYFESFEKNKSFPENINR